MLPLGTPPYRNSKTVCRKDTNWGYRWGYFAPHSKENRAISVSYVLSVGPSSATTFTA